MQPIDREDPRRPRIQIAAAIRAAILSGELSPGEKLPSTAELAETFDVSTLTVGAAVRILREEGYLTTKAGAGVWVRDQAALPVAEGEEHELDGTAAFLFEMGSLKHLPRAGWQLLGIPQPESVAEHSFRVAIIAATLAGLAGADPGRTALLGAFHDGHETRISDIHSVGRAYLSTVHPEAVTAHQTSRMPEGVAQMFADVTAEYEARETLESMLAKDADKIETLLQAIEYQAQGHDTSGWRQTSLAALRTDVGKQLAQAINAADPRGWFAGFQDSYHELRASTRGKQARKEG